MSIHGLVLPEKVETREATATYAKITAEPFERGYGYTVGHSLRRILLSSLEGAAVTAVRLKGAPHEFSSLKGVQEDVINILLNLRQLRFRLHAPGPETLKLQVKKGGVVKAKDFEPNAAVEILSPQQVIAHVDDGSELSLEVEVSRGRGYIPAEQSKKESHPVGTIPVDALFSPVTKVQYEVENARVGQMTDYDRLILEVWTDGSVSPSDAVTQAARILRGAVGGFLPAEEAEGKEAPAAPVKELSSSRLKDMMEQPVEIIELTVRASNCLKAANIRTIGELVGKSEEELMGYKNFGRKSLDEIRDRVREMGLELGMGVPVAGGTK
jgi:DNA-directed RNA polymerase subunit alpha